MKYVKPEVVALAYAVKAIESGDKRFHVVTDSNPLIQTMTNGAYEADE